MKPSTWRLTAAITAVSMALGNAGPAYAAPPPIASAQVNPPGRVGRLARINGSVSFHTADQTVWSPAVLNYPVTTGNALWTESSAEALLEVSGNRMAMDGATELDIATLDDHALVGSVPQGELYLNLQSVPNGDTYTIQTPRGAVQIAAVGRYEIVAGDTDHPTTVAVVSGAAQITGANLALQVGAGQMASVDGSTTMQGAVGPIRQDAFLTRMLAEERPAARSAVAVPAVVSQMTGYQDLDQYGAWSDTPQNGAVWYPRVEAGWAPYRHGRWSYVAPWGWTWVDEAPWGFAPFHYGRWVQNDDRWGWIPADPGLQSYPQPVYAPALISWLGIGAAVAAGAAGGALLGDRSVGWVPLGPNEPYYPAYSHSVNYVRQMNGGNVRNVAQVITDNSVRVNSDNRVVVQNFINRGGATVAPAAVMTQSGPIAPAARSLSPQQFAQVRTQVQAPVRPNAATAGVSPAVARQFNFIPATRAGAPGPAIDPGALRGAPIRGGQGFLPPLRAADGGPRPITAPVPGEPASGAPRVAVAPGGPAGGAPALGGPGPGMPALGGPRPGMPTHVETLRPGGAPPAGGGPRAGETARVDAPPAMAPRVDSARPAPMPAIHPAAPVQPVPAPHAPDIRPVPRLEPVAPHPGPMSRPSPGPRSFAPAPAARPEPAPVARPAPTHPASPQPASPQPRPQPQPQPQRMAQPHPAPAPQPRPGPAPQQHAAPAGHPPGHEEHH